MNEIIHKPICASPSDLYDFYMANHKDTTREDLDLEYEEQGVHFFRKLIEHFVEYHFPKNPCVVIREGFPLIRIFRKGKINWLLDEYYIDLQPILGKSKNHYKVLVIPFLEEVDTVSFATSLSLTMDLKINLWRGKEMSYEVEQ